LKANFRQGDREGTERSFHEGKSAIADWERPGEYVCILKTRKLNLRRRGQSGRGKGRNGGDKQNKGREKW